MAKKKVKKNSFKLGGKRLVRGRIDWTNPDNVLSVHILSEIFPFHARVIGERLGLSTSAVYYRLKQHGISLRDLRNGVTGKGKEVLDRCTAKKVDVKLYSDAINTHEKAFAEHQQAS